MNWRFALGAIATIGSILACGAPALAVPITLDRLAYDTARSRLTFEVTGSARIKRSQIGDHLIFDVPDAHLRHSAFLALRQSAAGQPIDWIRATDVSGAEPHVRIEIALAPGARPVVWIQQLSGHVYVSFIEPATAPGESASEAFPAPPTPPLPPLRDLRRRPSHIVRKVAFAPSSAALSPAAPPASPSAFPVSPALDLASPLPGSDGVQPLASGERSSQALPGDSRWSQSATDAKASDLTDPDLSSVRGQGIAHPAGSGPWRPGTRSYLLLDLDQQQALETQPGQIEVGYPTGPAGLDWHQWFGSYVGLGLDARYLAWTQTGTVSRQRSQGLANLQLGCRLPLGWIEPELFAGAGGRYEVFGGQSNSGYGALVGAGVRLQALDALGLRLWGRDYPGGLGGDSWWSLGASLLVDARWALASVGYTWDQVGISTGGRATYGSVILGIGFQY